MPSSSELLRDTDAVKEMKGLRNHGFSPFLLSESDWQVKLCVDEVCRVSPGFYPRRPVDYWNSHIEFLKKGNSII